MNLPDFIKHNQIECFLDFDGTITEVDTLVLLLDRFAPPSWWDIENEVLADRYNEQDSLQAEMDLLRVTWPEAREFLLREARLRAGFPELLAWLREREIPVTVLSGGFRPIIEIVFAREGIELPVCANDIEIEGEHWRVVPAPHPRIRDRCNHCKTWHLEQARQRGHKTIYFGDGTTDRCAAEAADLLFARDYLAGWCERQGVPYYPFEDFVEVIGKLE